jgi:Holliday junction resolvase RusA-like endonuclease
MNIEINIKPQAKQSVRGGKRFYTDPKKVSYVNELKRQIKKQVTEKLSGNILIQISYTFAMPKNWNKKKKIENLGEFRPLIPDLDNLTKPVLDSLNGIAFNDDSSVVSLHLYKYWGWDNCIDINLSTE